MAWNANILTVCLFLLVSHCVGQLPSPPGNPCTLYDLDTGAQLSTLQFDVYIEETDNLTDVMQTVVLPISGGNSVILSPSDDSDSQSKANTYGLQFFNDGTYNLMLVTEEINRDGADYQNNDDMNVIQFNLKCTYETGGSTAEQYFTITVWINDANDNAPIFIGLPYQKTVKEALSVQSTVFDSISATDLDYNQNKDVSYQIASGNSYNGVTYFTIPAPGTGQIVLQQSLDFEYLDAENHLKFFIEITATDQGELSERKTSTATLTITVKDSDDLSPTFYHTGCLHVSPLQFSCDAVRYRSSVISVYKGALSFSPYVSGVPGTPSTIKAYDMDKLSTIIDFSIIPESTPPGYANRFAISTSAVNLNDPELPGRAVYTATITQISPIMRQDVQEFSLFIKAFQVDDPSKFRTAEIRFFVEPSNNNNPVIDTNSGGTTGYITENAAPGTVVRETKSGTPALKLIVSDPDVVGCDEQGYTYETLSDVPFAIDADGDIAYIYATAELDRESTSQYSFTVQVKENVDSGAKSATIGLTIVVLDENDHIPVFTGSRSDSQRPEDGNTGTASRVTDKNDSLDQR